MSEGSLNDPSGNSRIFKVGTRGSPLALEQTRRVRERIASPSTVCVVRTTGDRFGEEPLGQQNPVGFFTREIEQALLTRQIDLAVHSLKDLPTELAPGLALGAMLERDQPSDVLIIKPEAFVDGGSLLPIRPGAKVGASSRRRVALLQMFAPDSQPCPIRGNVETRLEKVRRGDYDAVVLSAGGLGRLNIDLRPLLALELNPRLWPGAPGQSVIAVEARQDDLQALSCLAGINHQATQQQAEAERALLRVYGGGCHAPLGAYSERKEDGAEIWVAARGADGVFRVARFSQANLVLASQSAQDWIKAGCPAQGHQQKDREATEEWLWRRQ